MTLGICEEAWAVDDGEISGEIIKRVALRTAQHRADEQTVPSKFGHNTHINRVLWIGAANKVLYEIVATLHVL